VGVSDLDELQVSGRAGCPQPAAAALGHAALPFSIIPSLRMNAGDEISVDDLERFAAVGCRVVDISVDDASQLSIHNAQLSTVASFAAAHGWTMLLHLGALRSTSDRLRTAAGPAGGFAGMRAPVDPAAVASFLNELERTPNMFSRKERKEDSTRSTCSTRLNTSLPRTILLSLNPEAHAQLAVLSGSFVEDGMPGKVQLGPAWWWCDHAEGILDVLEKNAAYGVLSTFAGMTTDSRSLLSFVRHDYFRRLLCKWIAAKIASGSFPDDDGLLRPILENVCYGNARSILN
jgi:glucuronate isomerase